MHLHVRAVATTGDIVMTQVREFKQAVKPEPALLGRGRMAEARSHATARVRSKGELRYQQQAAANIRERAVHSSLGIGENAVAEQSLEHALHIGFGIVGLYRDQCQQAIADCANGFVIDIDSSTADALDQGNHFLARRNPTSSIAAGQSRRRLYNRLIMSRMSWSMHLLYFFLRIAGKLPLSVLHRCGVLIGRCLWLVNGRSRLVTERNLALIESETGVPATPQRGRAVLVETGKSITEIARIWTGDPRATLALVRQVHGEGMLDAMRQSGRGLIVVAPHLGCWELLNYWLAARMPLSIVYRPPKRANLEPFLLRARGALDVEQVRAEGAGVRTLYKRLQAGGAVGILPDQQPRQGEGEFAPFFGVEALTMVLVSRLAQRTNANVLFAFAERLPNGTGYDMHLRPAAKSIADTDLRVACTALNRGVEDCVRGAFDQYQWSYKRYSLRPDKSAPNPYK